MTYYLGIDLGTTYTAAATWRDGTARIVDLGTRSPVIPSVVFLRDDEEVLTGEAANRRGTTEPGRVAREFKRRIGDPTPIIVGGTPYSADSLTGKLLRSVVDRVAEREGAAPAGIAISHPANWGDYKKDLLGQAIALADLDDATVVTEPEAAAISYASQERVDTGSTIAVYDLGGGTFDAAVLRKTPDGFEILGEPQGVERLGGVDFDEAVFRHVVDALGGSFDELDPDDPTHIAAVTRLRAECVDAKEALSSDTDVSIPVMLPTVQTEVRLTRAEFEAMIRPSLADSITALRRALRSAGVEADDVSAVLLVGGSSRIPVVAQLVGAELGRPVAVDVHPKQGIALGAAITAALAADADGAGAGDAPGTGPAGAAAVAGVAAGAAVGAAQTPTEPSVAQTSTEPVAAAQTPTEPITPVAPTVPAARAPTVPVEPPPAGGDDGGSRRGVWIGIAAVVAVLAVVGVVLALSGGDDDSPSAATEATTPASATNPATTDAAAVATTVATTTAPTEATVVPTTEPVVAPEGPFVQLDSVELEGDGYRANWTVFNFTPLVLGTPDDLHIHVFLNTTEPANAGTNGNPPGVWEITDEAATYLTGFGPANAGGATQLCTVVATADHGVFDPASGNCVDLPT